MKIIESYLIFSRNEDGILGPAWHDKTIVVFVNLSSLSLDSEIIF